MFYAQLITCNSYGDNVEPDVVEPVVGENILLSRFHDQLRFRIGNKLFGISETEVGAGLYFGKYQQLSLFGNEVDFGVLVTIIPGHNLVTLFTQITGCFCFALLACLVMLRHLFVVWLQITPIRTKLTGLLVKTLPEVFCFLNVMNRRINKQVGVRELGFIEYQSAWDEQERLFATIVDKKLRNRSCTDEEQQLTPNYLLFCEHPPVYTMGTSGHVENLLMDEDRLATELGATLFRIRRGGDVTYHGPGQLVGYPILDLDNFFTDIHRYMRLLEESVILTLADYGLAAGRIDGLTGVWLGNDEEHNARKICAMGVKASRWVTMHGFALNVNTNLRYFDHIVPCGITDKAVTSMAVELGYDVPLNEVSRHVQRHMANLFDMEIDGMDG